VHPHGLGFLHQSYPETVAVTLGVHPFIVDAARAYIETPEGRIAMISATREARERIRNDPPPTPAKAGPPEEDLQVKGAEERSEEIRNHPLGARLLRHAPPEAIAVPFCVHLFAVLHAREILRRGRADRVSESGQKN